MVNWTFEADANGYKIMFNGHVEASFYVNEPPADPAAATEKHTQMAEGICKAANEAKESPADYPDYPSWKPR